MASEQAPAPPITAAGLARTIMRFSARLQQWTRFMPDQPLGPLTGRQAQLMTALETTNRPSVAARTLGVTPAVISTMVNRLEDQGLVRRAIRHGDRRAWVIEATEAGIAARDLVVNQHVAAMSAALASSSAEEVQTVVETLAILERLIARQT